MQEKEAGTELRQDMIELHQFRAPVAAAMGEYAGDGALAFHTPGHKQGLGAHPMLQQLITPEGLRQEVSLMEELDDLHQPEGCIKEAEELAAELWGARATLFAINGTTGAIHAMLLGTLCPGDEVLVPRNAHRSIIGGIILAGAVPVYIQPEWEPALGIPKGLSIKAVQEAIQEHPGARALVAVYPTYYGYCCNLAAIAQLVHEAGMLLLVDEAHGAHLRFCNELPPQALDCGADVVAQSTHKLLGSLTQTSMLHVGGSDGKVDISRLRQAAGMLQSTSPNQLLLASLDIARLQMAEEGWERVVRAVQLANRLRQLINDTEGLYCPGEELCSRKPGSGAVALDATKVTVNLDGLTIDGLKAELLLRHEYKIQCELSDARNLLFIISMADTEEQIKILYKALQDMAARYLKKRKTRNLRQPDMPLPVQRLNPREAFFAPVETCPLEQAVGRVCGETVAFYPPGIPCLCPGEEITAAMIEYIRLCQKKGMRLSGPADGSLSTIRVCRYVKKGDSGNG